MSHRLDYDRIHLENEIKTAGNIKKGDHERYHHTSYVDWVNKSQDISPVIIRRRKRNAIPPPPPPTDENEWIPWMDGWTG